MPAPVQGLLQSLSWLLVSEIMCMCLSVLFTRGVLCVALARAQGCLKRGKAGRDLEFKILSLLLQSVILPTFTLLPPWAPVPIPYAFPSPCQPVTGVSFETEILPDTFPVLPESPLHYISSHGSLATCNLVGKPMALESDMPKLEPWLPHVLAVTSSTLCNL